MARWSRGLTPPARLFVLVFVAGCGLLHPEVPYQPLAQRITAVEDGLLVPDCTSVDPRQLVGEAAEQESPETPELAPPPESLPRSLVPFTLEQALLMADQYNPRLQGMQARVEQARAGRTIAFAEFLPQAALTHRQLAGSPRDEPYAVPTIPTAAGNVAFGGVGDQFRLTELNLQWTVWDFGRRYGRYGRARLGSDIAELQFQRARQAVAYDVASAYFGVCSARARVRIGLEAVRRAEFFLRDARNFKKRGIAIRNDVLRAQVLLADAKLELVRARTAVGVHIARLSQVLGAPVPELPADELPADVPLGLNLQQCLERAVAARDEFQVVLKAIESASLERGIARADALPRVFVGATAVTLVRPNDDAHGDLLVGGINLEWKLFDGGKRLGKMQAARAELAEAHAAAAQVCDQIAFEVRVAYLEIADARERIGLSRQAVEQSRENLRVVRRLLDEGDAFATDVVDAELALTRAEQNLATALYDYQTALAKLTFALGTDLSFGSEP